MGNLIILSNTNGPFFRCLIKREGCLLDDFGFVGSCWDINLTLIGGVGSKLRSSFVSHVPLKVACRLLCIPPSQSSIRLFIHV